MMMMINVVFLFVSICIVSIDSSWSISLRGRLMFDGCSHRLLESESLAEVKLIELSSSRIVQETRLQPNGFPIHFVLKFQPEQIDLNEEYHLQAKIRDVDGSTIYQNQFFTPIIPLGDDRTMFADVAMTEVKSMMKKRWPELVGMSGEEAVQVIRKETGFTDVQILRQGSPMTMDFRTNRVRVIVDSNGLVSTIPSIA